MKTTIGKKKRTGGVLRLPRSFLSRYIGVSLQRARFVDKNHAVCIGISAVSFLRRFRARSGIFLRKFVRTCIYAIEEYRKGEIYAKGDSARGCLSIVGIILLLPVFLVLRELYIQSEFIHILCSRTNFIKM